MGDENKRKWAMFALHEFVELARNATHVKKEFRNKMGEGVELFLPVKIQTVASKDFQVNLFDGYAFVQNDGTPDFEERALKVRGIYIEKVLHTAGKLSYVRDSEIVRYRESLNEMVYTFIPEVKDIVEGAKGIFKSMVGIVVGVDKAKKTADVVFKTRTREVLAKDLSFIALAPKDDV